MLGKVGKTTDSDLELAASVAQRLLDKEMGEMPGQVVSFDPEAQTATISPLYKNAAGDSLPQLLEVPVRFPRAGGFVVTSPVKEGDFVTLRPLFRSSEEYHSGGEYVSESDRRRSSLSDMEAYIDGGERLTNPIPNFNDSNLEIRSEDGAFAIEMTEDGKFAFRGALGDAFSLLAEVVELLSEDGLDVKTGSSVGTDHALENRDQYAVIAAKLRGMTI